MKSWLWAVLLVQCVSGLRVLAPPGLVRVAGRSIISSGRSSSSSSSSRSSSSSSSSNSRSQPLWSTAVETDVEEDADEALIRRISAEVLAESGVELDQLINPSKVVNLERELVTLARELETCSVAEERVKMEEKMAKNRAKLVVEKRSVMRGWLKGLFVGQSVVAAAVSFAMVYDLFPGTELPLPIRVLGFWMWWLFIIPSLRARKPSAEEKDALNIAFLATPAVSLAMPVATKDVAIIWWANALVTGLCYAYAYNKPKNEDGAAEEEQSSLPPLIVKAIKALDYGSGQERGERK